MTDVNRTLASSPRSALGLALAAFAFAGPAQGAAVTTVEAVPSGTTTALALGAGVAGVYALAWFARSVTRKRLALSSVALWAGFLAVAGIHAVGLETVAGATPASGAVVAGLEGVTWATLLGAGGSTAFLGFREYGSPSRAPDEQVLEQGSDA